MKKVTLGLLITFVAVVMVAGPKPTAVPKSRIVCQTPACCIQHPNANGCTGSLLTSQVNLPRHPRDSGEQPKPAPSVTPTANVLKHTESTSGGFREGAPTTPTPGTPVEGALTFGRDQLKGSTREAAPTVTPDGTVDKTTTVKTTHSNTYKEVAPTTPTPGPVGSINLNSGRSNIYREGAPVTVTPTSGPVGLEAVTVKSSKSNGSFREAAPTVTPTDAEKQISGGKGKMPPYGKEVALTTPTPGPAESSNLNSSRSNTFREGAPVTVTPAEPVAAKTRNQPAGGIVIPVNKEGAPVTVTPSPATVPCCVKGSRSNGSERNSGHASESKPKPTPTKRAGLK